tara:strand:+ start:4611 stop:6095 length:1485 start_codon:yes stop_codon:yes gene_type:complete
MAFTATIPSALTCPEDDIFSLPTKEDLVNALNKIAQIPSKLKVEMAKLGDKITEEVREQIEKIIKDIEDFIDKFADILSPFWQKGTVRNWQKEINDAITELLQEFQIFVPTKIAELISKLIPVKLEINVLGIDIDILKILTAEEQLKVKTQIAAKVDKFFALIPDTFKGFNGDLGVVCDEWKAKLCWQYIKTQIQKILAGNLHGAFGGLIDKFDEIWDALGLPSLPGLFSFDVASLIDGLTKALVEKRKRLMEKLSTAVGDAREEIKKQIEDINKSITDALESISIGGFNLRSIIGGAIDRTVQSLEETVSEIKVALEDFVHKLTQKLLFDWVKIVKKFFNAIGLGKIFKFLFFTFCDLLKLIGMPFNINIAVPAIAGVMAVKKEPKKQSLRAPNFGERDPAVNFFNADGSSSEFELPAQAGSRLIFIDGKKDKMGLEDGGNILLETNETGPSGQGSPDKLSLEEATSGISVVGNKIVFETPPTNGQTVSIVNV